MIDMNVPASDMSPTTQAPPAAIQTTAEHVAHTISFKDLSSTLTAGYTGVPYIVSGLYYNNDNADIAIPFTLFGNNVIAPAMTTVRVNQSIVDATATTCWRMMPPDARFTRYVAKTTEIAEYNKAIHSRGPFRAMTTLSALDTMSGRGFQLCIDK